MRKNIRENIGIQFCVEFFVKMDQGVKVVMLGRQNERNSSYVRLAHTSFFGLCFMFFCLMKSNCYFFIYSSLRWTLRLFLDLSLLN